MKQFWPFLEFPVSLRAVDGELRGLGAGGALHALYAAQQLVPTNVLVWN